MGRIKCKGARMEVKVPKLHHSNEHRQWTKTDEIGTFPHEISCLTLFFVVVQRDHAKHNRFPVAKTS